MAVEEKLPVGYRWRSSTWLVMSCIAIALFSENFLQSYIVPILPVMLQDRLHVDESATQAATSLVLSFHALTSMVTGPLIGYLADRVPGRKASLVASLAAEMLGTVVVMVSPSVPVLLVGRALQAIGGNAAWIVGLATLAETVGRHKTGKSLGAMSSFFGSGLLFGPMASGMLLPVVGYWATWSVAVAVLGVDLLMRLVMVERGREHEGPSRDARGHVEADERTALLGEAPGNGDGPTSTTTPHGTVSTPPPVENFYLFVLTSGRALAAVSCHCTVAIVLLSLDTTLPLHAFRTFGWDTAGVSLLFLLLQLPALLLATITGMLKDRVGARVPTGVGLLTMALFLWLLGAGAQDGLFFLPGGHGASQTVTMVALVGIGTARTLVSGSGILEMTNVVKDAQGEKPGRFGPNGKMSSAYSITNFFWNMGMLLGPIISGGLAREVGYCYMNVVVGTMCCVVGVVVLMFLGKR